MKPAPKRRTLQSGPQPRTERQNQDPNECADESKYQRALVGGAPGAMPAETFQYDIVFEAFRRDTEFWNHWKVVGCARNSPQESISQQSACIRVVMNLPSTQKLFPTAYTPGFSTVPCHVRPDDSSRTRREQLAVLKELPPGYSVALDVHLLEDARIMLAFQRSFRGGQIDPKHRWLDAIVSKVCTQCSDFVFQDEDQCPRCGARRPQDDGQSGDVLALQDDHNRREPTVAMEVVRQEAEAKLRPPVGSMSALGIGLQAEPLQETLRSDRLQSYSEKYADSNGLPDGSSGLRQVYEENTLVYAFGNGMRLPPREGGSWESPPPMSSEEKLQQEVLGREIDRRLYSLLDRTRDLDDRGKPRAIGT